MDLSNLTLVEISVGKGNCFNEHEGKKYCSLNCIIGMFHRICFIHTIVIITKASGKYNEKFDIRLKNNSEY